MNLLTIDEVFDKLIVEEISPNLVKMGFSWNKKRTFQKKIGNCKQELNVQLRKITGKNAGYIEVCPGFVYNQLEKVAAELKGEKLKKGWPTAAANIGNLKPKHDFIEWPITTTTDIVALGELISSYIKDYALPFWDTFSTIKELINGYEKEDSRLTLAGNSYRWKMVAAYCLVGNKEHAKSVLDNWEKGRPSQVILEHAMNVISKMS